MIIIKVIAGIVGYIMISILTTVLMIYIDRKAGEPAQKVYKEDEFFEYCTLGFLFPISIPCIIIGAICKFIKIICIMIVELKIATEKKDEEEE